MNFLKLLKSICIINYPLFSILLVLIIGNILFGQEQYAYIANSSSGTKPLLRN